jgi:predicted 3-demethylubiquinone-9 3-methyltransferase (glyoxalase superfamily)
MAYTCIGYLLEGGDEKAPQRGWLKYKYGVSWQIVPIVLIKMLKDKDTEKSES